MASQSPSEFSRRNRAILAERLRWPDGALQACADLEDAHPGWHVSWLPENVTAGWERAAGFWATHPGGSHAPGNIEAFAATAAELEPLLVEVPEHTYSGNGCDWCLARL
jgi:hypothetical protein